VISHYDSGKEKFHYKFVPLDLLPIRIENSTIKLLPFYKDEIFSSSKVIFDWSIWTGLFSVLIDEAYNSWAGLYWNFQTITIGILKHVLDISALVSINL